MTDLQYPKVTIQHLNAPEYKGTWRENLWRLWVFDDGVGTFEYFDHIEEAVAKKGEILKEIQCPK